MTWTDAIVGFTAHLRAAGRTDQTVALRRSHLSQLAADIGVSSPWAVTERQLVSWVGGRAWARETRRSWRSTLTTFYRWGVQQGHIAESPAEALPTVPRTPPRPRPATNASVQAAMFGADARERLALRLGAEAGLRRGEIVLVHSRDLIEDLLGWSLVVHGKGGRERTVPITDALAKSIQIACRKSPTGYAFPGKVDGHLSAGYMGKLLAGRLVDRSAHTLRHRFAQMAYEVDRDLGAVQDLLGHASPETTRHYVAPPRDHLRRTVEAVALRAA